MAYDTTLATCVRRLVAGDPLMVEKKMFGGLGFILQGNMACGIHRADLGRQPTQWQPWIAPAPVFLI